MLRGSNASKSAILYTLKFLPGANFRQFHNLLSLVKILSHPFFCSYVSIDCIEDMAAIIALVTIISTINSAIMKAW